MIEENTEINEAITVFYKLKNEYEKDYYDKYIRPIVSLNKSRREKKSLFQKLPKPKCVNCGRNVGTLFSIKADDKLISHKYSATCGDISDPCPLNIQIQMSNVQTFDKITNENSSFSGPIATLKTDIIKAKNDLLFGYIKQENAFQLFDQLTNKLKDESEIFDIFLEKYIIAYDNPEKKELLTQKKIELEMNIQELKNMMTEYNNIGNEEIVYNAVELYVKNILPILKEIMELTYAYNSVEYIEKDGTYVLIQKKNTLEQLEHAYSKSKLISYVFGTVSKEKAKNKTLKTKTITQKKQNKTKKQPPVLFEIVSETPEELVEPEEPVSETTTNSELKKSEEES
jgi:hypothetical protein